MQLVQQRWRQGPPALFMVGPGHPRLPTGGTAAGSKEPRYHRTTCLRSLSPATATATATTIAAAPGPQYGASISTL